MGPVRRTQRPVPDQHREQQRRHRQRQEGPRLRRGHLREHGDERGVEGVRRRQQRPGGLAEPPAIAGGKSSERVEVRQDEPPGAFEVPLPERAARRRHAARVQNTDASEPDRRRPGQESAGAEPQDEVADRARPDQPAGHGDLGGRAANGPVTGRELGVVEREPGPLGVARRQQRPQKIGGAHPAHDHQRTQQRPDAERLAARPQRLRGQRQRRADNQDRLGDRQRDLDDDQTSGKARPWSGRGCARGLCRRRRHAPQYMLRPEETAADRRSAHRISGLSFGAHVLGNHPQPGSR